MHHRYVHSASCDGFSLNSTCPPPCVRLHGGYLCVCVRACGSPGMTLQRGARGTDLSMLILVPPSTINVTLILNVTSRPILNDSSQVHRYYPYFIKLPRVVCLSWWKRDSSRVLERASEHCHVNVARALFRAVAVVSFACTCVYRQCHVLVFVQVRRERAGTQGTCGRERRLAQFDESDLMGQWRFISCKSQPVPVSSLLLLKTSASFSPAGLMSCLIKFKERI